MESAKTDYAAALAIPAQITGDLPSTVLGKTVTWSATGDGAKLVAADGKVTQPKSGEKAVKVKLTATIDGVDKAITAESESSTTAAKSLPTSRMSIAPTRTVPSTTRSPTTTIVAPTRCTWPPRPPMAANGRP